MGSSSRLRRSDLIIASLAMLLVLSCAPDAVELPCPLVAGPLLVTRQPTREVDILLVVDSSGDMEEEQARFVDQLPRLANALSAASEDSTNFDLASVRFAVVSADMGSGGQAVVTCDEPVFGDDGLLRNGERRPGPLQECVSGGWTEFQLGEDPEEFTREAQCLAYLGIDGCGIEQPLESALKAVTSSRAGPIFARETTGHQGRNGLTRDDALLVVLVLTNEDDCSIEDEDLLNRASATYTDPNLNTRCWRYEDQALHPIRRYVDELLATVVPARLVFGVIAGIPTDLVTEVPNYEALVGDTRDPRMDGGPDPVIPSQIARSCEIPDGGAAHAPVRLVQAAQALDEAGANVILGSLCQADYAGVIDRVASAITQSLDRRCLREPPAEDQYPCAYLETLPEGARCEITQGRVLDETLVGGGRCRVCLSNEDGAITDPHPACRALADAGVTHVGWYAAHDETRRACHDFIAFHPGSQPVAGARPWFHCVPPPATPGEITQFTSCRYDASICEASTLPAHVPLACDAVTETCQIPCDSDSDCEALGPDPYLCNAGSDGRSYCRTLCCGCSR